MTKRMLTMLLAAAMLLAATGCTPSNTAENSSSSSVTTEELQVLQEENEKLKQELAELKGESSKTEGEEPKEEVETESSAASEPAAKPTTPPTNTQAPVANNNSSSATASKPNNQAAKPQAEKPAANNTQTGAKPQTPAPQKTSSGKGPLAKYTVRVKDKTTPAVNVQGELYEGELAYVFYSDSGKVLGTVPDSSVGVILRQEGLTQAEDDEQKSWFVENFNIYRGLDGGSYEVGSGSTGGGSTSSNEIDIEEFRQEVIRLTNKERKKAGLEPLVEDSTAMEYAQIRAEELAISYSHTRPNGEDNSSNGLNFIENGARGSATPEAVVNSWMNSDVHKATLLGDYSDYGNRFGVGCYQAENGKLYWSQEFVLWDANA